RLACNISRKENGGKLRNFTRNACFPGGARARWMIVEGHTHPLPRHGNVGQRFFRFRLGLLCSAERMRPILPGTGREDC
ncbi:MAG: hypothetical protein Q8Q79_06320, partial [Sphingopyxis sp.]|nr:hypothetical protein [Sphingopyxis sp.]